MSHEAITYDLWDGTYGLFPQDDVSIKPVRRRTYTDAEYAHYEQQYD